MIGCRCNKGVGRWPTTVASKEMTSLQKKETHDKRKNLTAEEKTSRQKE